MRMTQQNSTLANQTDQECKNQMNQFAAKRPANVQHRCVYTASEVQQMLGIGKNETYRLIHSKAFPSLRIGHRIVIPKETFHRWLNGGS